MAKIQINKKGSSKQHTCEFGKRKCDQAIEWSRAAKAFADFSYIMGFYGLNVYLGYTRNEDPTRNLQN